MATAKNKKNLATKRMKDYSREPFFVKKNEKAAEVLKNTAFPVG